MKITSFRILVVRSSWALCTWSLKQKGCLDGEPQPSCLGPPTCDGKCRAIRPPLVTPKTKFSLLWYNLLGLLSWYTVTHLPFLSSFLAVFCFVPKKKPTKQKRDHRFRALENQEDKTLVQSRVRVSLSGAGALLWNYLVKDNCEHWGRQACGGLRVWHASSAKLITTDQFSSTCWQETICAEVWAKGFQIQVRNLKLGVLFPP